MPIPHSTTWSKKCEFENWTIREYSKNLISSKIYEEGDANGYSKALLHTIVDHKSTGDAVKMADKYITT